MAQSDTQSVPLTPPRRSAKWRRRIIVAAIIVVVLAVGGWLLHRRGAASTKGEIRTATVGRATLVEKISSSGIISAETGQQLKIGSQITGRIKHLYADVGSVVKAGQVVVELDAPDLAANLESARRNYQATMARYQQQLQGVGMVRTQYASAFEQSMQNVRSAEARLAAAKSHLTGYESALTGARARQSSAESQLRSARASSSLQNTQTSSGLRQARAALSTAQANLERTRQSVKLDVNSAEAALAQAKANSQLAQSNLDRQTALLDKGYVSPQDVDALRTQRDVAAQQVLTADNNLNTTRAKSDSDLQAAQDGVEQAQAALATAEAGSYQDIVRTEGIQAAQDSLVDAKASVVQAQTQIESGRSDLTTAQSDLTSAQAAQRKALSDLTQNQLKQQDVKAAYESMLQAKAQMTNQEAQYQKSYIRTPISGTVISLAQQEGETVAAGLSAPELIEVAALDRLEVLAYVDETDIGKIKLGQKASVTVDAFPDKPFPGKVTKIASSASVQQNVVTYPVTIKLDSYPVGQLKPQMTIDAEIVVTEIPNALVVPTEAVKNTREGAQVVVLKNGQPDVLKVTVGLASEGQTEILSGLNEGETVVLAGFEQLGLTQFRSGNAPRMPNMGVFGPGTGSQSSTSGRAGGGR